MTKQFFYRILTSIFLFLAVYLMFIDNIFLILFLSIIFIISYYEFYKLIILIKMNLKLVYFNFIFYNILFSLYLSFFTIIIYNSIVHESNDKIFILFILFICILTDVGGIFFGKLIGGKKLTKISPNKTISGSIGSFIFSILPIFLIDLQNYIDINFYFSLKNILFCLIISLTCQLGDLFISYFKRLNKVKNTGSILPGHGGLLDRIDGIIFAIPTASILKLSQIF